MAIGQEQSYDVSIGPHRLRGIMTVPERASGLVIFAHGSGSARKSPRNNQVAAGLREDGLATLLLDLLSPEEEQNRSNVFDIHLLASRLAEAADWSVMNPELAHLRIGYFGASTGAAAALVAAAEHQNIGAVVSRGGRPDLAGAALDDVRAPSLLIVGGADTPVVPLNRAAFARLTCEKELVVVPGATHLFEEPGALEQVTQHAKGWFSRFLPAQSLEAGDHLLLADRRDGGRRLVPALLRFKHENPIVLALPRGGVPVGYEVAQALRAPLDVVLVRKIGAPGHEELGLGAVVDGVGAQTVMNDDIVRAIAPEPAYIERETSRQLAEIERRRRIYRAGAPPVDVTGRTAIVVDDGIATGGTVRAVLKALKRAKPRRLVLAVPVAPRDTLVRLRSEADEVICLVSPEPFLAVGHHYEDFDATSDQEVVDLLRRSKQALSGAT
jgi:predicted phosphoribosyltransferase/dienelactone hydrolase